MDWLGLGLVIFKKKMDELLVLGLGIFFIVKTYQFEGFVSFS
jgi:hypothetical protein